MDQLFDTYIKSVAKKASNKQTSEMGYRTDFEILLKGIFEKIKVKDIGHDDRAVEGNRPDFIISKNSVPLLYIEAKDIGTDLNKVEKSEQMARYFGYTNLVLTDYVEFRFYRHGKPYSEEPIKIANYDKNTRTVHPNPDKYNFLFKTLLDFPQSELEPITSGKHLSQIMGGKAQRIRDYIKQFLSVESEKNDSIKKVYEAIKKQLVHDLTPDKFADMYSQTLVYGLFVARYHDDPEDNQFSRRKARDLVPQSNPLLRHFFDHIAGVDFDTRLEHIVNELCEVFNHANVSFLMKEYYKTDLWDEKQEDPDPVIHFYEDFLKEYDPELRKKLGAFYTPLPVVRFITRSVDYILKKDFKLPAGLADTSKLPNGKHRVQILDPATGTGTFISAVIRIIHQYIQFTKQDGCWKSYVHHDLLPRIHGFEIMMAPYTIAHLKLSMAFKETGFIHFNRRLGIYLTNSLEESFLRDDLFGEIGFAGSIAEESREASKIKNQTPIMVVLGNPPYSISSTNKGKWILDLIKDYKKDLNEKKINLDDDYIKFIRFAEHFIEKNKTGIVAMITNNSFIDGITHRQMRKHLLETFDDIYILDLHGNSKKKEKAPDGSKDENVFNIMQGVSINIFVRKNENKTGLGNVFHSELYGLRFDKFKSLNKSDVNKIKWCKLDYSEPYYFFVPKDFDENVEYETSFKIDELFAFGSSGIESAKDDFIIKFISNDIENLRLYIENHNSSEISNHYNISLDKAQQVKDDSQNIINNSTKFLYRPFDTRYTLFSPFSQGVWWRPRYEVMKHMLKSNLGFIAKRGLDENRSSYCFISKYIIDRRAWSRPGMQGAEQLFPLYLYSDDGTKTPNLNKEILTEIEKTTGKETPENILDYIYAVLHSPSYREKYKEFLKIDFPRVPYPKDKTTFKKLVALGSELRSLHLLESPKVNNFITSYPVSGTDKVEKIEYKMKRVYINQTQYFGNVPEVAWNFYIGGYQPAQKWLKDRKGRTLTNEDLEHYQKIIIALTETDRIMREIDKIEIEK
jgi:predicted helicase